LWYALRLFGLSRWKVVDPSYRVVPPPPRFVVAAGAKGGMEEVEVSGRTYNSTAAFDRRRMCMEAFQCGGCEGDDDAMVTRSTAPQHAPTLQFSFLRETVLWMTARQK
jgi:hypothetical protein